MAFVISMTERDTEMWRVDQELLAERFEEHRLHLRAVAYRMLGSLGLSVRTTALPGPGEDGRDVPGQSEGVKLTGVPVRDRRRGGKGA